MFIFCSLPEVKAQENDIDQQEDTNYTFDEFPVFVIIEGFGYLDAEVIYTNNDLLFVNVEDLFKKLKIACIVGQEGDSIGGFIGNESSAYSIDYKTKQIKIGNKIFNFPKGFFKQMGSIYMESSLFAETFGITLTFNFRSLSLILKADFELPVIKELRLEQLRTNMSEITGEVMADTIVARNYHLFNFGTLDWSLASVQTWKGATYNHIGFGLGTELLYGEADVSVNYNDRYKFSNRQLYYLWRWVDNDKTIIKQAQVGTIYNQTISFINSPMVGAVVRNSPTSVRKATGYYTINEYTEPNWTVELYINNVLIDYTKADASGLYIFKVPIVYGYTVLKLKFYGPLGEERTDERTMNLPYTIMPTNEFEYGLTAGIVQDSSSNRFGKAEFNYGVNHFFTLGGGIEYLSSIPNNPYIPYAKATIQPFSQLILNAEYANGVRTRGLLNYYFWKDALLEIDYAKYVEGQLATIFNAQEERKVKLSLPFRFGKITGYSKLDYTQYVYKTFNYNQSNLTFSVYYKQFGANSSSQLNYIDQNPPYVTSELALSYRSQNGLTIRPSAQYNASEGKFMTYKLFIEQRIKKAFFSISYNRNILFNDNYINLNLSYDLSFARTNIAASYSEDNISTMESAQGSMAFGAGNNYIYVSNNSSVGKGGISLYPFLDLNNNGIFDDEENMVKLTSVRINGGRTIFSEKDSIVRIPDLNAFINYTMEFNDNDLENIAWRFKNKIYSVLIDPNQFKHINIPIISVGEVTGMVYITQTGQKDNDDSLKGIGRILIKFYKKDSDKLIVETLSESDGYIYYMGLEPGEYIARIDSAQLSNLNFTVEPSQIDFTINPSEDGDMVGGINFVLSRKPVLENRK